MCQIYNQQRNNNNRRCENKNNNLNFFQYPSMYLVLA